MLRRWPTRTARMGGLMFVLAGGCAEPSPISAPNPGLEAKINAPPGDVPPGPPGEAGKPVGVMTLTVLPSEVGPGGMADATVTLIDKKGAPIAGREVTWSSSNGGLVSPTTSVSGTDGKAMTVFTGVTTAGTQHLVTASSGGSSASQVVTVVPGPAANAVKETDAGPTAAVGSTVEIAIRVTDAFGNPVAGHSVEWQVQAGGGSIHSSGETDENGVSTASWTLGTLAGSIEVANARALPTGPPVGFSLTTTPGPAARIEIQPQGQTISGTPGEVIDYTVQVFDQYNNEILNPTGLVWEVDPLPGVEALRLNNLLRIRIVAPVTEDASLTIRAIIDSSVQAEACLAILGVEPPPG